ncbi:MAG TPA: CapA family protein [Clostridiales bacterium]|nr:CapA family protein [Clostridiales bacterium]HPV01825.1 CapA family protein [Clostridiales bacterium]
MKKIRTLTVAALVILAAACVTMAILYHSEAYRDRQVLHEQPHEGTTENEGGEGKTTSGESGNDPGAPAEDGQEAGGDLEDPTAGSGGQADDGTGNVEAPAVPELRFIAVGDIMLGRGVEYWIKKNGGGYESAFAKIKPVLELGDIVFGNLECPLTSSGKGLYKTGKIVLKAEPESVAALTSAGFNLISLANNHIMDYYEKGLFDTMELLDRHGIVHAGGGRNIDEAREMAIIEKNGMKIGLLAYTDMAEIVFAGDPYLSFAAGPEKSGVAPRKYELIKEDIEKNRDKVDLLVISLHWGIEDSFRVTDEQVEFAHRLIDDGADMILGHHPHQFQGIEIYNGKPILYSMGNFLFDQNESENMESFIVDMKYKGTELAGLSAVPVRILKKSYVEIQTGSDAAELLSRQADLSRRLGTEPVIENDILVYK